jgi:hypothetical protein
MGNGSRLRGFARNNYKHPIKVKVGSHALTIIYVDMKTSTAAFGHRLKPGDRIKYREQGPNHIFAAHQPIRTAIVADETVEGGTLFITRHS